MFYNKSLICLLIFNCWTCAWTSITIFDDKNNSIANIDSLSAAFGPSISDDGLEGYIIVAKPLMGCTKLEPPPNVTLPGARSWIALIQRTPSRSINNCTFDLKVYNAQRAGYSAAIIFDYDSDILIRMSSNNVYNVRIPSVFIGHSKGVEISQKYTYENKTYAILYSDDADMNYLLIPFVSVVSICFLIAICVFLTKLVIHCQKVRKNRFPKSELKKIPTKKYQKTDKYDTCPICLNEYEEGVKIRILPCEHAYHVECIDKWLLRNNRLCPVCKRRVIPGGSDSDSEDNETSTSSSNQPLLGTTSSGIGGQNRRVSDENEPNEEDDTNETSRLLVRNNSNNPQQSEDTSSVLTASTNLNGNLLACGSNNLLTTSSSHLNTAANGDIGSMNNQMMTTSISNTSQIAVRLTSNLTTTSKYGSITSINQTDETIQPTTARANLNFHDDNDDEIGYQYANDDDDDDDEQNYQSSKPTSSTRAKNINALKLTAVIDSKQTPEYYTPYETHQRPNKSPSSSSNHSSRSHSLTTQTTTTTTDECQKPKEKISKTKSKSKPTPAMKDFAQIAAQLEAENKKTTNVDATTTETTTVAATVSSSSFPSSSSPSRPTINDEPNNVEFTEFQSAKEDDSDSLATPDTSNNSANQ